MDNTMIKNMVRGMVLGGDDFPIPFCRMLLVDNLALTNGVGVATFTRSTTGTYIKGGRVVSAEVDEARFESTETTDNFSRHETNIFRTSDWVDIFTSPFVSGGATVTLSNGDRTATFVSPSGGRAFIGATIGFVAGRTYCLSCRVDIQSGSAGTKENMAALVTTVASGEKELNFPSSDLLQVVFTASTTESKTVRYGIGISGNESVASTMVMTEPLLRDVTDLVSSVAPSDMIDSSQVYLVSNENTITSNVVTEVSGNTIPNIRKYDSGVMFGDSFTNDTNDLGSNLSDLVGVAFQTEGIAGDTLTQIGTVLTGHSFKSSDNFVMLEGGINDILAASTDPNTAMQVAKLSQVSYVKSLGRSCIIYTVGPWKNNAGWTAEKQGWTDDYNQWVKSTFALNQVVDMYAVLEDPSNADELLPAYDSGDGLHPSNDGYLAVDIATAPILTIGEANGVLLEGASTNELLRSEEFDDASWVKTQLTVTANDTTSPDGSMTADKLVSTVANAAHFVGQLSNVTSGITYTQSVYVKANGWDFIQMTGSAGFSTEFVNFNLSNGTKGNFGNSATSDSFQITALEDDWYRCEFTTTATSTTSGRILVCVMDADTASRLPSPLGDGVSGVFLWGAQLEELPFASSYIPTTTVAVTRTAELLGIDSDNIPVPTLDYSVSAIFKSLGLLGANRAIMNVTGEAFRFIRAEDTGSPSNGTGAIFSGSSGDRLSAPTDDLSSTVVAVTHSGSDSIMYVDGVEADAEVVISVTGTKTDISIGSRSFGEHMWGHLKEFRIYDVALTAEQVGQL